MRRAREPALWPATVAAALLLGVSFVVLARWLERGQLTDVPVYEGYAHLIRAGSVPYRDFTVEYPPAALPAFLAPAYLPWSYATSFAVAMGVCAVACLAVAAASLRAVGAGRLRATAALAAIGLAPLALGSLFDTRFDLWPTLLALAAVAALLRERPIAAGALGGLAFAAKLWPLALAPIGLAFLWRRLGRRAAVAGGASFALVVAACFVPFAVLAPAAVWHSLTGQLDRPLQIESLGAAVLIAAHHVGGLSLQTVTTHGSQNLGGGLADAVAAVSAGLEVVVVAAISVRFARVRRPTGEALLAASAAVVAALVAFGKVFSPQFLIWLVPVVPLVRGRRGFVATVLLGAALGLTQTWFPGSYWTLALGYATPYSWFLLTRDLAVVTIAALLAWPSDRRPEGFGDGRAHLEALRAIGDRIE